MTDAVDPLKVWEYFAFGQPVIATSTAFVRERAELFHIVDGSRPLADVVAAALADSREGAGGEARQAAARERSWATIAAELSFCSTVWACAAKRRPAADQPAAPAFPPWSVCRRRPAPLPAPGGEPGCAQRAARHAAGAGHTQRLGRPPATSAGSGLFDRRMHWPGNRARYPAHAGGDRHRRQ